MKLDVFDKDAKVVSTVEVSDKVFGVIPNKNLLTQYIRVFLANQRQGTSATKTRSERSGGGRKPWRQKGTGRARHGSIRSPLWRKGGVAHGPKPKSWNLNFSKRMKRAAMTSALSSKQLLNQIKIINNIELDQPKTKTFAELFEKLNVSGKSIVVLDNNQVTVKKSVQNIKNVDVTTVDTLNAYQLLTAKNVVMFEDGAKFLSTKYEN